MSDLILRTKLEILGKNLKRLQDFSNFVEQRRSERISRLLKSLQGDDSVGASINNIDNKISEIIKGYKTFLRDERVRDVLTTVTADGKFLQDEIDNANNHLYKAIADVKETMQDPTVSQATALRKIAGAEFEEKAKQLMGIIDQIQKMIVEASGFESQNKIQDADNKRREAWNKYSDQLHKQSQNLFTEYVDFVRGLAMRDAGLDEGICQLVDELISRWNISNVSHSFSIPDRYEAVSMTLSRIIRIGFPEWTIWAMPLAVHELGHIAMEENETLKKFVEKSADEQSRHSLREILCDAFATYVMGPAYACAVILLRFNPLSKVAEDDGHTAEAKRVHVILDMLAWMSSLTPGDQYRKLIKDIKKEWEEAMRQAGQPADLKSTDQNQLNAWMIESNGREQIKNITSGYAIESHNRADVLQGEFTTKKGTDIEVFNTDDLVIVLNAAWLGRTYYPDKTDVIEKAALSVWDKISDEISKRKRGGRPAPAAPPRSGG